MPLVLCGLAVGLDRLDPACTADAVARSFATSLDPALHSAAEAVEVYRLERVAPDAVLGAHESVMCRIPDWRFDFRAVEDLLHQLDDLREDHDCLQTQYSRTKEALMALSSSIEASEAASNTASKERLATSSSQTTASVTMSRRNSDDKENESSESRHDREVALLRQQLAQSEKKQQESKAAVLALRREFMHLVSSLNMVTDAASAANRAEAKAQEAAFGSSEPAAAGAPLATTAAPSAAPVAAVVGATAAAEKHAPALHLNAVQTAPTPVSQPTMSHPPIHQVHRQASNGAVSDRGGVAAPRTIGVLGLERLVANSPPVEAPPQAASHRVTRSVDLGSDMTACSNNWMPDGVRGPGSYAGGASVEVDKLVASYGTVSHHSAPAGHCIVGATGFPGAVATAAAVAAGAPGGGGGGSSAMSEAGRNLSQPATSRHAGGNSGRRVLSPNSQRIAALASGCGGGGSVGVPVGGGQLNFGRPGVARPRGVRQRGVRSAGPGPLHGATGPTLGRLVPGGDGYST